MSDQPNLPSAHAETYVTRPRSTAADTFRFALPVSSGSRGLSVFRFSGQFQGDRYIWRYFSRILLAHLVFTPAIPKEPVFRMVPVATLAANLLMPVPDLASIMDDAVRERFTQLPYVEAIYRSLDQGAITFWLLTNNETYDDAIMDALLSQEEAILDRYPQITAAFRYIPSVLCPSPSELIGAHGVLIFQR